MLMVKRLGTFLTDLPVFRPARSRRSSSSLLKMYFLSLSVPRPSGYMPSGFVPPASVTRIYYLKRRNTISLRRDRVPG